ncbi:ribosome maturation factor RimP [Azospirillum humicireducens]|uniref:Ribosome maturation factor RimP n=1 Tax=Azospirillum humicireducens TaxID=1226968 RepID=A0A160JHQ7_9PROT|nr:MULTISPECIES: ribosome maturation factor RimP [Azospirillum]ANC92622.1 ribosome maturation factor RimP [Azospirillum humicireducens]KAA0580220.1 ribosome maturation factor RimP [Azospirillum sp. B21]
MDATGRIEQIITPSVEAMGYEVVRVQISGGQRSVLQIMAERADGAPMTVEDCADISRSVSALLDVEDPIREAYTLEVSSPGIDRPLTRLKDFERFAGFEARLESRMAIDGRKRFKGMLKGVEDGLVCVDTEQGPARLEFDNILRAKLVLTDELIRASQEQQEGPQN